MAGVEVAPSPINLTSGPHSRLRRSLRTAGKERPIYADKLSLVDDGLKRCSPKKRGRPAKSQSSLPKKPNSPPKNLPHNNSPKKISPKKRGRPASIRTVTKGGVANGEVTKRGGANGEVVNGEVVVKKKSGPAKRKPIASDRCPIIIDEKEIEPKDGVILKSYKTEVRDTIRLFDKHYLRFVQEEQMRVQLIEEARAKKQELTEEDQKRPSRRPDLKSINRMIHDNTVLNPIKRFGHIPGICVGDRFYSRAEMVVVGMHSHWLNGIDYLGKEFKVVYPEYAYPLATCIVLSGMYEDDLDKLDEITYTGQGGHDLLGNKMQIADQKLVRGNLALKNSMDCKVPVRVVRGHDYKDSYSGKVYSYDGLYEVIKCWPEKGIREFTVYKYKLKRLPGQSDLTTHEVRFTRESVPQSTEDLRGKVLDDLSGGQENFPIPVTNLVNPPEIPTGFVYEKRLQVPRQIRMPGNVGGCNCEGDCATSRNCSCRALHTKDGRSEFAYVRTKDGIRLVEARSVVYECGANCRCGFECINRLSQQGLQYRLEVFKTVSKGWAVRSWDTIPSGAPICEYTGVLKRTDDIDSGHLGNNYIFDIDCLQTMKGLDGREQRSGDVSLIAGADADVGPDYCIDAGTVGNVARFINHSCAPNLFVQCVLSSHRDVKLAKIMLFAAYTIPPLQELTYDYGYALDSVVGPDGKIVELKCHCGAPECRKRLY